MITALNISALLTAFISSLVLGWLLKRYAAQVGLVIEPGEHRQHTKPTPVVGGIAIVLAIGISSLIWVPETATPLLAVAILLAVGVIDDSVHLPSWLRLGVQCMAVYVLVRTTGVLLIDLGDLVGNGNVELGSWGLAMTVFACIGVINAINMSDGMDGLAGCLVIICCVALLYAGSPSFTLITIVMAAVLGFLVWNMRFFRSAASIFMGDAGSTSLGLLLAYLLIQATQGADATIAPVTALWLLAVPLIDAVGVLIVRPIQGRSPFSADHLHYHHALRELKFNVNQTLFLAISIQAVLACCGLVMHELGVSETVQFGLFLFLFGAYLCFLLQRSKAYDF